MEGYCIGGIPWDTVEDDLKIILNHSDCDGILTSEECGLLAARLTELIGNNIIKEEIHDFDNDEDWNYLKLKQFRDGCVKANKRKQIMEFQ